MALRGRDGIGVIVIMAYWVGQVKGMKAGPNTAYMQQWVEMRNRGELSPDLRNSILHDISTLINEWAEQGYHPLVMIDVNAASEEKGLESFIEQHDLFDLIADVNEGLPPPTYARGSKQIDHALGDQHGLDAVLKSGALALHGGISFSDHTLQFVDFDVQKLFNSESKPLISRYEREFSLSNSAKEEKFLTKLHEIYEHQRIPERLNELARNLENHGPTSSLVIKYQKLDDEIVQAIRTTTNSTRRKNFGYQ